MFQLSIYIVLTCQPITKPRHGEFICDNEFEFVYGASCLIKCNDGYEMDPPTYNSQQNISCELNASVGIQSEQPNDCKGIHNIFKSHKTYKI